MAKVTFTKLTDEDQTPFDGGGIASPAHSSSTRGARANGALAAIKRGTALAAGLCLVILRFANDGGWILLASIPMGLSLVWILARRERTKFGQWQDYAFGGCIGSAVGTVATHLLHGASAGPALLYAIAPSVEIGCGLGLIAYAIVPQQLSEAGKDGTPQIEQRP